MCNIVIALVISASLCASTEATVDHPNPKSSLKKRETAKPLPPPKAYVARLDSEQNQYLNAHNAVRKKVGVPPLSWDANLAASAHAWTLQRREDCKYRVHSPNMYGENIYWMNYKEFTPYDVVWKWFDEYKSYDHVNHECKCMPERAGCECGHYLNVIWSNTKRVGCSGAVYCNNQKGVLVVCQYDPAGLFPGINPFTGKEIASSETGVKVSANAGQVTPNGTKTVSGEKGAKVSANASANVTKNVSGEKDVKVSANAGQVTANVTKHS